MRRLLPPWLMIVVLVSTSFAAPTSTTAAPAAPSGPTLRALTLNGTNTFVEVTDHTVLSPAAAITLEAWVYRAVGNRCEAVLGKDWTQSFWLGFCNQRVRFYVGGGAGSMTESNASVPAGTWTHVAATYDNSTGERRFYINGVLDRAVTGPAGQLAGNTLPLYIGADRTGAAPAYFFSGMLDQVRIWNRALTESEIRALLYKVTNDAPEAFNGLIGEWRFDGILNATAFWPVSLAGTGRGAIGYETNGVVPIDPYRIPLAATAPTVDGNCGAAEYAQAERVGLRSPVGREVYLQATANDLWVCFSGLPQEVGLAASVAVDPDSSRDSNAPSNDYRFTIRQDGTTQAEQGTGGGGWAGVLPAIGAWQAAVGGPGEFVWNAEFRIGRVFLGRLDGWDREPLSLALFERSLLNLPGLTPNPWPAGAAIASPATWSQARTATLVGGPPLHRFNGQVATPAGAGVAGATVQLLGSDGGSGELLAQAITDASGNFTLEYRGYALDLFTVQEIDPRGAFSL